MKSFQNLVIQSYNGPSFTFKVTQVVSKALDITYYLHCAWRPQSLRKVERANQFLKSVIKKRELRRPPWDGRRFYQQLSSTPVLPLRNRLALDFMRCYMGDILFMSMTSSQIQRLSPSGLIRWPLGNSKKTYTCGVLSRT